MSSKVNLASEWLQLTRYDKKSVLGRSERKRIKSNFQAAPEREREAETIKTNNNDFIQFYIMRRLYVVSRIISFQFNSLTFVDERVGAEALIVVFTFFLLSLLVLGSMF